MVTRYHKNTDSGAPVLTGQIDSLNNLLHALLVTGIGGAPATPWTREYNDTTNHIMVWRPPSGNRHYLQSNDNGPGGGTFKESRWRGHGAMTAASTGTDPFPTTTQKSAGIVVRKSSTLDATARPWRAAVDEKTLYLWIEPGDTANPYDFYAFGQYLDWVPSGAWGSLIMGRLSENSAGHGNGFNSGALMYASAPGLTGIYSPRGTSGTGTAVEYGVVFDAAAINSVSAVAPGASGQAYPYTVDGGIIIMPARISTTTQIVGRMRGVWFPGHNKPLVQDDTFTATEGSLTRSFIAQNNSTDGQLFVETSNTWDTE